MKESDFTLKKLIDLVEQCESDPVKCLEYIQSLTDIVNKVAAFIWPPLTNLNLLR